MHMLYTTIGYDISACIKNMLIYVILTLRVSANFLVWPIIFWCFLGRAIIFLGKNWTGDKKGTRIIARPFIRAGVTLCRTNNWNFGNFFFTDVAIFVSKNFHVRGSLPCRHFRIFKWMTRNDQNTEHPGTAVSRL